MPKNVSEGVARRKRAKPGGVLDPLIVPEPVQINKVHQEHIRSPPMKLRFTSLKARIL